MNYLVLQKEAVNLGSSQKKKQKKNQIKIYFKKIIEKINKYNEDKNIKKYKKIETIVSNKIILSSILKNL